MNVQPAEDDLDISGISPNVHVVDFAAVLTEALEGDFAMPAADNAASRSRVSANIRPFSSLTLYLTIKCGGYFTSAHALAGKNIPL